MNGNGWKNWIIGALLGLLLGGGGSALFGHSQASAVEVRLNEKIEELSSREERSLDALIKMAERLARMETKLANIEKQLDRRP